MVKKPKENYSDDYDEEYDYDEEDEDNQEEYKSSAIQGERGENLNSVDRIFNTESLLYSIRKTLLGWEFSDNEWKAPREGTNPVATTETINKIINSMRSIIHTSAMLSSKTDDEINFDMLEINKMVIFNLYDDIMVDENDFEYIVNLVDHTIGMFMGIIKGGEGSESARQILSGTYLRLNENQQQNNPAFRIGSNNMDYFTFFNKRSK